MGKSENKADREKLFCFGSISSCLGATLGLWLLGTCDRPPAELGQYQSRVVGGDTGPSVPQTSHLLKVRQTKKNTFLGVSLVVWGL